jgi:phosphomannomutase
MLIERIAGLFSARVFRTETGEANVVSKAAELRHEGYTVRILGEGSNGGNITHPATVRDPLNTLVSLLKLLCLSGSPAAGPSERVDAGTAGKSTDTARSPWELWCSKRGIEPDPAARVTVAAALETLPPFVTTGAYEPEAKLRIRTNDHGLLKRRYEELFLEDWEQKKAGLLEKYGIASCREVNYEGTRSIEGFGPEYRSGRERGGLKIIFSNADGLDTDFIWMRGSGTEPVFRVLADCEGDDRERHDALLGWHRSLIERADNEIYSEISTHTKHEEECT